MLIWWLVAILGMALRRVNSKGALEESLDEEIQ